MVGYFLLWRSLQQKLYRYVFKLISSFSVVWFFSELMQRIFKYGDIENTALVLLNNWTYFDIWNAFLRYRIYRSYINI